MIKRFNLSLITALFASLLLFNCNSDNNNDFDKELDSNEINSQDNLLRKGGQIDYNPDGPCPLSGPQCVLAGGNTTFTISCNAPYSNGNVLWSFQNGVGITPTTPLGPGGLGGTSQTFTFSSNFQGGWIQAVCEGSFGCKDYIQVIPCSSPPPSCSIFGPNCGFVGDTLNFSFIGNSGGQTINWSSSGSGITLSSGQGTNSASFTLGSSFNGGIISATKIGAQSCTVNFPITNCCNARYMEVDDKNHFKIKD